MARKLGIRHKILHDWIKAWKAYGPLIAAIDDYVEQITGDRTKLHTLHQRHG